MTQTAKQYVKRTQPGTAGVTMPIAKEMARQMHGRPWHDRAMSADTLARDLIDSILGPTGLSVLANVTPMSFAASGGSALQQLVEQFAAGYRTCLTATLLLLQERGEKFTVVTCVDQALLFAISDDELHNALAEQWMEGRQRDVLVAALTRLAGVALVIKANHFGRNTVEASVAHDAVQAARCGADVKVGGLH